MSTDKYELRPMKLCDVPPEYEAQAKTHIAAGAAYALCLKDKVIGVGGVRLYWEGVGQGWLLRTVPWRELVYKALDIYDIVDEKIKDIKNKYGLHRIQATVVDENIIGHKFLMRLSFQKEGILKKYGEDKRDSVMYARVWEE